jgi:hypothetical protein
MGFRVYDRAYFRLPQAGVTGYADRSDSCLWEMFDPEVEMRRLLLLFVSVTAIVLLAATLVYACGDKLLVLNRGLRFQDLSSRPASILLYTHPGSRTSAAVNDSQLQSALQKAGHKVQLIGERGRLDDALKTGRYDLVLVDLADAPGVEDELRATPSAPVVVPVVYEETKAEAEAVRKHYRCLLKTPDKKGSYLNAIDRALEEKAKRDLTAIRAAK